MKEYKQPNKYLSFLQRIYYSPKFKNFKTKLYLKRFPKILDDISKKKTINIVFFIVTLSMWKYEFLVKELLKDKRFNIRIIPYPYPHHSKEEQIKFRNQIIDYCNNNKFPYQIAFDIENQRYVPANELKADIISYTQPYNGGYNFWKLEKFWKDSIFFAYPYGLPLDTEGVLNYTLLQNIAWKHFYPTNKSKSFFEQNKITKGFNFEYVGNTIYDRITNHVITGKDWKINKPGIKKIIWAPHHSIDPNDVLPFSNFLDIAEDMKKIASKYSGKIEMAFKPHPYLRERLNKLWGNEKTDEYYHFWENSENTSLVNGDYIDLFASSDAMIHDCGGFTNEYLYTKNPVIYVCKPGVDKYMSNFAKDCFNMHYHGNNIRDIEVFIQEVVLYGKDRMKSQREDFYNNELIPPNGNSTAKNMYHCFQNI